MPQHLVSSEYMCRDCVFIFKVHSRLYKTKTPYCPNCGDNIFVRKFVPTKKMNKRFWTEEELDLLDKVIDGKLFVYQLAIRLGRTNKSVEVRLVRRRRELENQKVIVERC